ncbi:hypothetical protein [Sporosarcina gallistercoris]|uniref:Spore coat protein D n=1 Tax=Sporosarcina gallistercoris TaxID=2762245 RepID=A0ABR8PHC2_9BACL|nr:hypothetical protein [Sporosarcina gallistercoris]MBD7907567.1 hypothetical protein [Sporosarcina gallistercoris]
MMQQNHNRCMKPQPMPPMKPCNNQAQPVICPTQYRFHDTFMPQELPVVHPFVNVNRQHTVQIPRHYYTEVNETMTGQTVQAMPGYGPGMGQWGPQRPPMGPGPMPWGRR